MLEDRNETVTGRGQNAIVDAFTAYVNATKHAGRKAAKLAKHMEQLLNSDEKQNNDDEVNSRMMGLVGMLAKEQQQVEKAAEQVKAVAEEHHPAKPTQFSRMQEMCREIGIAVPYEDRRMVSRAECVRIMHLLSGTLRPVSSVETEEE